MHGWMTLRVSIVMVVLTTVLLLTVGSIAGIVAIGGTVADEQAAARFAAANNRISRYLDGILKTVSRIADIGAATPARPFAPPGPAGADRDSLAALGSVIDLFPAVYSVYIGWPDGRLRQVINARGIPAILAAHDAPAETWSIARDITAGPNRRRQSWWFYDRNGRLLTTRTDPDTDYDPRRRVWYGLAKAAPGLHLSEPYIFHSLQDLGITISRARADGAGVFGVDLTLSGLRQIIATVPVSQRGSIALIGDGDVILALAGALAEPDPPAPLAPIARHLPPRLITAIRATDPDAPDPGAADHRHAAVALSGVDPGVAPVPRKSGELLFSYRVWSDLPGLRIGIVVTAPAADFTGSLLTMQVWAIMIGIGTLLIALPLAYFGASRVAGSLHGLTADAERMRRFDFSGPPVDPTFIREFGLLTDAFALMKQSLHDRTAELAAARLKLEILVASGISIAAETDTDRMMAGIVAAGRTLTNAEGGTLYLIDKDRKLQFNVMQNEKLGIDAYGEGADMPPAIPLDLDDGSANQRNIVSHAVHSGQLVNVHNAQAATGGGYVGTAEWDALLRYRSISVLTIPLRPRGHDVIGALQLINARDLDTGAIGAFSNELVPYAETLAALAATVLHGRLLADGNAALVQDLSGNVAELQAARWEAQKANALKRQIVSVVSHEFRTPLHIIIGFCELMFGPNRAQVQLSRDQVQEYGEEILTASRRLLGLVDEMLRLIDIELDRMKLSEDVVDLDTLLDSVVSHFTEGCMVNGQRLRRAEPPLPPLIGDSLRLKQAMFNLMSNSLKYTPRDGEIRIGVSPVGPADRPDGIELFVEDTGPGIADEDVALVMQPFAQLTSALERGPADAGLGIGLSVAKAIAELHGGALTIDRAPEGGARVALVMPADRILSRSDPTPPDPAASDPAGDPAGRQPERPAVP